MVIGGLLVSSPVSRRHGLGKGGGSPSGSLSCRAPTSGQEELLALLVVEMELWLPLLVDDDIFREIVYITAMLVPIRST